MSQFLIYINVPKALAARPRGIVSACGLMGREIESRRVPICRVVDIFVRKKELGFETQGCHIFLVHDTTGKNVPNEHKMYRMVIKYPKFP
jgi:hypothetical protein